MPEIDQRRDGATGGQPRRGRPRIPAAQQRERLFKAAERLIGEAEDEIASVQAIVREAQMSSRSFYEFFDSKEDLLVELAELHAGGFLSKLEAGRSSARGAVGTMERFLRIYFDSLPSLLVDLERLGGRERTRVRAVRARTRLQVEALLEAEFVALHDRGEISKLPPHSIFALVLHGLEALVLERRRSPEPPGAGEVAADLPRELTDLFADWVTSSAMIGTLGPMPSTP